MRIDSSFQPDDRGIAFIVAPWKQQSQILRYRQEQRRPGHPAHGALQLRGPAPVGVVGVVQQQEQPLQHDCRAGSTRAWIVATPQHGARYDVTCVGDDVAEQHGSKGPLLSLNRHRIVRIRQPSHPPSPQPSSGGDDQQIHGTPTGMLLTKGSPPTVLPPREDEASGDTRRAPADRRTTQGTLSLPWIHLVIRSQAVDCHVAP
jgi:hypothetical protein